MRNLIGIDIGGTSADISLINDGRPGLTTHGHIGDWPLGLPMVDVITIGAGGGSLAHVDGGTLRVGPQRPAPSPGRSATSAAATSRRLQTPTSCWGICRRT